MRPTLTNNMQSHRKKAFMQQAVKQGANISSMSTYKANKNMKIKMNATRMAFSKMIKIIYEQDGQH